MSLKVKHLAASPLSNEAYFTTPEPEDRRKEARRTFVYFVLSEKHIAHTSGQTFLKGRLALSPANKSEMKLCR